MERKVWILKKHTVVIKYKLKNMLAILLKKEKLFFLIAWSLLACSILRLTDIFILSFENNFYYFIIKLVIQAGLYYGYYHLLKRRYDIKLNYIGFIIENIIYSLLILLFAFVFYKMTALNNGAFYIIHFFILFVLNLMLSSILFLVRK